MGRSVLVFVLLLAGVGAAGAAVAEEAAPCAACAAVVIDAEDGRRLPVALNGLDVLVRQRSGDDARVFETLRDIRARGGRAGLLIDGLPDVAAVRRAASAADVVLIRLDAPLTGLVAPAFDLKLRLSAIRGALAPHAQIGLWTSDQNLATLFERDLAAYLDVVASTWPPPAAVPWWRAAGELTGVRAVLQSPESLARRSLWRAPGDPEAFIRAMDDLAAAAAFLSPGLIPATAVAMACNGQRAPVWLEPATLDHVAWMPACSPERVQVSPGDRPSDRVMLSTGDLLVRVREIAVDRFAQEVDVRASRLLTVEEIVARHQAAAARQSSEVRSRISTGRLTLAFEAPGFAAPVTINSDVVIYSDGIRTDIEQRALQINGLAFGDDDAPRLPLVEPERVASMPLEITLTDVYTYTLEGVDQVDGLACYVVRFEPVADGRPLFRGRAWIAADTFALVKVAATQVGLRGPIVSSQQTDEFVRVAPDVWLLRESRINQVYQGAGHRTPIERILTVEHHDLNPRDFTARRAAAYASDRLMLRDTAEGYRYLQRTKPGSGRSAVDGPVDVTVANAAARVRTVAFGVILDPNITRPLPFAGLSYVDFDLFGTGTQFSGFFGGTFGQLAFSIPALAGTGWQLAGRAFAVASAFNDRAFADGREQYDRNILQRPASASVWALRRLTPYVTLRAGYELDYVHYAAADTTRADFTVPPSQVVHAMRVAVEAQRRGWNGSLWWAPAARQGWGPWGLPDESASAAARDAFHRYGATLAKSAVLAPRLVVRGEAAWMSGRDLDRFSRYAFGAFENRLTGYPGALIRYDRGAVVRAAAAWTAAPRLRLDAFADSAFVRDPSFGPGVQRFTGVGTGVEVPAPFGTLVSAEWGFGIQGVRADGRRGTQVFRVTAYKAF